MTSPCHDRRMSKPLAAAGGKLLLAFAVLAATGRSNCRRGRGRRRNPALRPTRRDGQHQRRHPGDRRPDLRRHQRRTHQLRAAAALRQIGDRVLPRRDRGRVRRPAAAAPFLGRGLDRSLFDVSALVRNGDAARIPVNLSFSAGTTPAAPPGVTLTSTGGGTATDTSPRLRSRLRCRTAPTDRRGRSRRTTAGSTAPSEGWPNSACPGPPPGRPSPPSTRCTCCR